MGDLHVVFGATGALGSALVRALLAEGLPTRAVARDEARARALFGEPGPEVVRADAADPVSTAAACQDAGMVYHAVNLPYSQWGRMCGITDSILAGARAAGAALMFPGNVYVYGRPLTRPVSETHPHEPRTGKGQLRLRLEARLMEAHFKGDVPVTIARFPDFYGPGVDNPPARAVFTCTLAGKPVPWPVSADVPHEFILVGDAARAMVALARRDDARGAFFNVPGPGTLTGRECAALLAEAAGRPVRLRVLPPWLFLLAGLPNAEAWEFRELLYLWQNPPLVLDGSRYQQQIGPLPQTPYEEGIAGTLAWWRERAA